MRLNLLNALAFLSVASLVCAAPQASAEPPSRTAHHRLERCDHYMKAYARSSARKLERALAGQRYQFEALHHSASVEVDDPAGHTHQFDVLFEKDGTAAGVVDQTRHARTSWAMVATDHGPVIASHRWPTRQAVAAGAACKPVSSTIVYPRVPVSEVDVDPFKLWGLRVMWHLPTHVPAAVVRAAPLATLRAVIRAYFAGSEKKAHRPPSHTNSSMESP